MPELHDSDTALTSATPVILLVDDLLSIRNLGKLILDRSGYTTLTAGSGAEALSIYDSHRGIDLVILDLNMPGISGLDTWRRLREINPAVRVIIASGYSEEAIPEDEPATPVGFITKPFAPSDLVDVVRDALPLSH